MRLLVGEYDIKNEDIEKVQVYQASHFAKNFIAYPPQTSVDTASSLKYLVAVYLLTRKIGVDWYENYDKYLSRKDFQEIANKVEVIEDVGLQKVFEEEGVVKGKVEILTSEKKYEKELNLEDLKGNPRNNPMTVKDIMDKFASLSEPVIGVKKTGDFLNIMENIDYSLRVQDVLRYLKP